MAQLSLSTEGINLQSEALDRLKDSIKGKHGWKRTQRRRMRATIYACRALFMVEIIRGINSNLFHHQNRLRRLPLAHVPVSVL